MLDWHCFHRFRGPPGTLSAAHLTCLLLPRRAGARANLPARVVVKRKPGKIVRSDAPGRNQPGQDAQKSESDPRVTDKPAANAPCASHDSDVDYSDDEDEGLEDYKKGGYHPVAVRCAGFGRSHLQDPSTLTLLARATDPQDSLALASPLSSLSRRMLAPRRRRLLAQPRRSAIGSRTDGMRCWGSWDGATSARYGSCETGRRDSTAL